MNPKTYRGSHWQCGYWHAKTWVRLHYSAGGE